MKSKKIINTQPRRDSYIPPLNNKYQNAFSKLRGFKPKKKRLSSKKRRVSNNIGEKNNCITTNCKTNISWLLWKLGLK